MSTGLGLCHFTFAVRQQRLSPLTLMARPTPVSEVVGEARSSLQSILGGEADSISLTLCDSSGLELAADPPSETCLAGSYTSLIQRGAALSPDGDPPVVLIETEKRITIIKEIDGIVVAASQKTEQGNFS
eukprot:77996_1